MKPLVLAISLAFLAGPSAYGATVTQSTTATRDGAIVDLALSNPNGDTDPAYAVLLSYSQGTTSVNGSVSVDVSLETYQGDFDIASVPRCNPGAQQCQGANAANVFSPDAVIPESITTVTITGLQPGDVIDFVAENSPGLTAIDFPEPWSVTVIPEPATAGLLALGLALLSPWHRRGALSR